MNSRVFQKQVENVLAERLDRAINSDRPVSLASTQERMSWATPADDNPFAVRSLPPPRFSNLLILSPIETWFCFWFLDHG